MDDREMVNLRQTVVDGVTVKYHTHGQYYGTKCYPEFAQIEVMYMNLQQFRSSLSYPPANSACWMIVSVSFNHQVHLLSYNKNDHARKTVDGLHLEDTELVGCADERAMLNRVGRRRAKSGETPLYVSAKAAEASKSRQYGANKLNSDLRGALTLGRNLKRARLFLHSVVQVRSRQIGGQKDLAKVGVIGLVVETKGPTVAEEDAKLIGEATA
ncbi:hypothetical protein BD410DRAFT_855567 [Rickenella mellea]|uniref:Uncharacterized protein n=1 Tax=Rickenella mellea TaxID=50990 RepID=A0A4Y7Q9R4_9AGAM|nr:hypothetical protein BD410DRAFT_855567 [Rickenella mellea]